MRKTLLVAALFAFAGSAFAAPVTYKLDPNHTLVLASWNHKGFSHPSANFGEADGTLVYDAANGRSWVYWQANSPDTKMGPPISYEEFTRRTGMPLLSRVASHQKI